MLPILCALTHYGLVMTWYGNIDLGQHWLSIMACCLMAPSHCLDQIQPMLPSQMYYTVSAQVTMLYNEFRKYDFWLLPHLPGASELTWVRVDGTMPGWMGVNTLGPEQNGWHFADIW